MLLNTSDSFDAALYRYAKTEVLALPVMAPFLTELQVFNFACAMRPAHVVPLHDGFAREFFIKQRYDTFGPFFERQAIQFHRMEAPGSAITLVP